VCGIAGYSLNPDEGIDALNLARHLLLAIESRGPHATGAVWTEADGNAYFDKAGVTASRYIDRLPLAPTSQVACLHTRYATKGSPRSNGNNHPFVLPGVSLVHNGVLRNDDAIFARLGVERTAPGQTDSEAIAALLAYGDHAHPTAALEELQGDAAVAWIETDRPRTLHVARVVGRPLAIGFTPGGSALFASTVVALRIGARAAGLTLTRTWDLGPRTYVRLWRGRTQEVERFGGMGQWYDRWEGDRATRHRVPKGRTYPRGLADAYPLRDTRLDPRDLADAQLRLGVD
jgi:glucosamine 6-phosphate synthetase-like amidotransferase/phosphosugar isomerase protein